jgi:putative solute:sodium symporter small subunit
MTMPTESPIAPAFHDPAPAPGPYSGPDAGPGSGADANPEQRRARLLAARAAHWARTRRLTTLLLALWLATGFGTVFFARDLVHLSVFGWPLSFYLAAQGASLIYLAIIGGYAWRMRILDRDFARALGDAA